MRSATLRSVMSTNLYAVLQPACRLLLLLWLLVGSLALPSFVAAQALDLVVRNGRIVDGSGNPWYKGDVGVRGGMIVEVGNLAGHTAKRMIDAKGMVIAPGFVDLMGVSTFVF